MRFSAVLLVMLMAIPVSESLAGPSARLRVSVTIPPPPCELGGKERCEDPGIPVLAGATSAIVGLDSISFVGASPVIVAEDDLTRVLF